MQEGNCSKLSAHQEQILAKLKQEQYAAGAKYDSLQVTNFGEGYRGVISTQPIKKGQTIVYIPKSHLITLEMAKEDPICQHLIDHQVELMSPKHTYLAIFLLQEYFKQDSSKWSLYLSILPKDLSSFPINYTNEELTELIGSPFLMQIHEKVYDLKRDYDRLCLASTDFRKYMFRDFCWARTIVGSRIFGLLINGVKTDILAPFADMLNHKLPKQTAWNYIDQREGFVIESLEDIPAGVEVFDSYGKKCNSRYLLNYGFVVEQNGENQVCLRATIDGEHKAKKLQMLKKSEGLSKILKISSNLNENNFYESMGFLRFKAITDINHLNVLEKISGVKISNEPYVSTKTPPINTELQIKIWKILRSLCQSALKQYSTSLEEDRQLAKTGKLTENVRNIVILRAGEKTVLYKIIEYSVQVIEILSQGHAKTCQYLLTHQEEPWSKYLTKIMSIMPGQKSKILTSNIIPEPEGDSEENEEELNNS